MKKHPTEKQLRWFKGDLFSDGRRFELLEHISQCDECAERLKRLDEFGPRELFGSALARVREERAEDK